MRKSVAILLYVLLFAASSVANGNDLYRYRVGATYGLGNLKAGEKPYYSFNHMWGLAAGINGSRTALTFGILSQRNYSNPEASGHFTFFSKKDDAKLVFKSLRTGFDLDYHLIKSGSVIPTIGAGIGYMIWEYADPEGDTVVQTVGDRDNTVDFSAAEMYLSGSAGIEIAASEKLIFGSKISVDYLTGLGASFSDSVNSSRGRLMMRFGISLSYLFGAASPAPTPAKTWPSEDVWSQQTEEKKREPVEGDSDGDGIKDKRDKCPGTPPGAIVDKSGCPIDTDHDGVVDGIDECPRTPRMAVGFVDMFGCQIDADFDGVPDYRDTCRASLTGVVVDDYGCPVDSDGDGVYDGRDDCPDTPPGIEVDGRGCMDIAFLNDTLRIHIEYQSGSFEVDVRTRERLQPLIRKLKILTDVRIKILGYTDNVGPAEANQSLSQKRANRMRDWLAGEGIERERMTPIGKGETNFIASNQTADGRAKNRRIELVFFR
jgi:outer membrane protein OmpA-like peptidoglycan-associated protein